MLKQQQHIEEQQQQQQSYVNFSALFFSLFAAGLAHLCRSH